LQTRRFPVAALVALLLVSGLAACTKSPAKPPRPSSSSPEAIATGADGLNGGPALPLPASGAYVGAWVKPPADDFSQSGRVSIVDDFQQQIGRPLDIIHTYRQWEDPFLTDSDLEFIRRGQVLQYAWAGTDTRTIVSGRYDDMIRANADAIRGMGRPIMLEWRWEMDRPNLQSEVWSADDYTAAWRHIWTIFKNENVQNVSWVWCPTAGGFDNGRAPAFYPGDDVVDWLCVDAYPGTDIKPMADLLRSFLQWAKGHPKPIIIGEYGVPLSLSPADRAAWLTNAAAVFRANAQIKAVSYFESNPADHQDPHNYQIRDDPVALAAFKQMVNDPYFNPAHRKS
jgi:glycosyl hydrolase family 26